MAIFLDNYPVPEENANLALTEETEKYCRVVYKLDDKGGAVFSGLWDPDAEYSDEYVILPVRSTGGSVERLHAGTKFANVIGSTPDPIPEYYHPHTSKPSWLGYWISLTRTGYITDCCTDGKFYIPGGSSYDHVYYPGDKKTVRAECGGHIDGGHVIINAEAADSPPKNGLVFLVPICHYHNICCAGGSASWGTGYYMKLKQETTAVKLKGYLTGVKPYIDEIRQGQPSSPNGLTDAKKCDTVKI